jgi:glycosyltransferase involved in cell wall biosynthesis
MDIGGNMLKLLMNRKHRDFAWGGGNNLFRAIHDYSVSNGVQVVYRFEPDLSAILMVDPRRDELGIGANEIATYKALYPGVRVVHRVNECDARKGTKDMDKMLTACGNFADVTVYVSNWMKGYFGKDFRSPGTKVILNGVNHEQFRPQKKFNDGKTHIVAHHWSDNYMKGFDIYEALDTWVADRENFTFTYIGRERGTFKNTKVIPPMFGEELGRELGRYDIYVSGSRFDPGPNHIIEALACGIPTFAHRDGGGASEFVGVGRVYDSFEELIRLIEYQKVYPSGYKWDRVIEPRPRWEQTWESCAKEYFDLLNALTDLSGPCF